MDTPYAKRELVILLYNQKVKQITISNHLNIPSSTVNDIIKRYKSTGNIEANRGSCGGHNRLLSIRNDRLIARECQKNPQLTARQLQATIGTSLPPVSLSTFKNSLRRSGKMAYRPLVSPRLSKKQMKIRLEWARQHQYWTVNQWKRVSKNFYKSLSII